VGVPAVVVRREVARHGLGATCGRPEIVALAGASTGRSPAVSQTIPPPESGRHNWADLLRLLDDLDQARMHDPFADHDRARRIRDRFGECDGRFDDPDEGSES
jgi:hypothetical protein